MADLTQNSGNKRLNQIGWANIRYAVLDTEACEALKAEGNLPEDPKQYPHKVLSMRFGKQLFDNDSGDRNFIRVANTMGGTMTLGRLEQVGDVEMTIRNLEQKTSTDDLSAASFGFKVDPAKVAPAAPVSPPKEEGADDSIPF